MPDPAAFPDGCRFHPRCPFAIEKLPLGDTASSVKLMTVITQPAGGRRCEPAACLKAREAGQALPGAQRSLRPRARRGPGGRRHQLRALRRARRWRWSANRAAASRLPAGCCCACSSRRRARFSSRAKNIQRLEERSMRSPPPRDADDLPGPVRLAQPAHDRGRHAGRAAAAAWPASRERTSACCRAARAGRPRAAACLPLSARVLGRPAPAHRHRARARGRAAPHRVRRAGVRARRLDPGAGDQPAAGPAAPLRPRLRVHRPRPRGSEAHCELASR